MGRPVRASSLVSSGRGQRHLAAAASVAVAALGDAAQRLMAQRADRSRCCRLPIARAAVSAAPEDGQLPDRRARVVVGDGVHLPRRPGRVSNPDLVLAGVAAEGAILDADR